MVNGRMPWRLMVVNGWETLTPGGTGCVCSSKGWMWLFWTAFSREK
jgi:hypothetical protein